MNVYPLGRLANIIKGIIQEHTNRHHRVNPLGYWTIGRFLYLLERWGEIKQPALYQTLAHEMADSGLKNWSVAMLLSFL